jgi:hypothetical protein
LKRGNNTRNFFDVPGTLAKKVCAHIREKEKWSRFAGRKKPKQGMTNRWLEEMPTKTACGSSACTRWLRNPGRRTEAKPW